MSFPVRRRERRKEIIAVKRPVVNRRGLTICARYGIIPLRSVCSERIIPYGGSMRIYTAEDHSFVICAYKKSPYLEECIRSLLAQRCRGQILIATSTPNAYIAGLAEKYELPLFTHDGEPEIGRDWNFAYRCAKTPLVTIAHQDDIYAPAYVESALAALNRAKEPILYFNGYGELRDGTAVYGNRLLTVKRLMLFPLRFPVFWHSKFLRRRILSLGCPICCPSVVYLKSVMGDEPFDTEHLGSLDWQQWEKLSRRTGSFVYDPTPLTFHRIHSGSATTEIIRDNTRTHEDLDMFLKFWPRPVAKALCNLYAGSQKSNRI